MSEETATTDVAGGANGAGGPVPISPAKRKRLQEAFNVGMRNLSNNSFEYAATLFGQCVSGDPHSLEYAQRFLEAVHQKFKGGKGGGFAALTGMPFRQAIKRARKKEEWYAVVKSGIDMLMKVSPYDVDTLLDLAEACRHLEADECELLWHKAALDTNPKDPKLNKAAAIALARQGHFGQAITCWARVQEARPDDPEPPKMMSELTVQRTMPRQEAEKRAAEAARKQRQQEAKKRGEKVKEEEDVELTVEEKLQEAIKKDPEDKNNYVELAHFYASEQNFDDAEKTIKQAIEIFGKGDLNLAELHEDYYVGRWRRKLEIAERRAALKPSKENDELVRKIRAEMNRVELGIYTRRAERSPANKHVRYELGVRLKRARQFKEAIVALQEAQGIEGKYRAAVFLELGECFQYIKKPTLAEQNYDRAIQRSDSDDTVDTRKLALYRAGVLATKMRKFRKAKDLLTELAGMDYGYRDVAERLDRLDDQSEFSED